MGAGPAAQGGRLEAAGAAAAAAGAAPARCVPVAHNQAAGPPRRHSTRTLATPAPPNPPSPMN
jgi:hypothetical protein